MRHHMPEREDTQRAGPRELEGWSDRLYRNLVERVPAVVYIDSNDQRPDSLYVSPQVQEIFGHPAEDYLADQELWRRQTHPDDVQHIAETWRVARAEERGFECEYRMIRPEGRVIWVRDSAVPVRGDDGHVEFWQGVMYDITDAKHAEQDLREAEEKWRALVENLPAVIYLVAPDDDRRTLYVSPHVERTLGYSRSEWLQQPDIWMELLHSDDREPTLAAHDQHNRSGAPWNRDYRLIAADGRAVWFRDMASLVRHASGDPLYWHGLQIDITELKLVEEQLRATRDQLELRVLQRTAELEEANVLMSLEIGERRRAETEVRETEHRYRLLAEQIPAVTYTWTTVGDVETVYTSPRIEQLLGYTPEEWNVTPDFWESRLHPDDRTAVIAASLRSESTGELFEMEYRCLHKDGHIVWVLDHAALLSRVEDGRPSAFQGVMLDITSRKQAEAAAAETETRYRSLTEQLPGVTYVWEHNPENGTYVVPYVSPQIEPLLGYTPQEWCASIDVWTDALHPEDRDSILEFFARVEQAGEDFATEYRILSKDGRVLWVQDQGRLLARDALGRPTRFQGLMVDVTERQLAEEAHHETEQRYRTLVEELPAITFIEAPAPDAPRETRLTYVSPQVELILGYRSDELTGDPTLFERTVHPEDRERVMAANVRSEETGEAFDQIYRRTAKDGRVVWLHTRAVLVRDERGDPRYWHGMSIDISDRMRAEESLHEMEARYEDLAGRVFKTLGLEAEGTPSPGSGL
jgi:PAS domain S-box-containing protein